MSGRGKLTQRVGRRIAEVRRAQGMTQEVMAVALGIAVRNLQTIESGRQNLTLVTLERVAEVLGVDPVELLR